MDQKKPVFRILKEPVSVKGQKQYVGTLQSVEGSEKRNIVIEVMKLGQTGLPYGNIASLWIPESDLVHFKELVDKIESSLED